MKKYEHELWDNLPFEGFDRDLLEIKKKDWYEYADKLLEKIRYKNVALVAETSAGKTIITILAILAGNFRCLFLAPTRYLCEQHQKLLLEITGNHSTSKVITGLSPKKERFWNYPYIKITFSTPHMTLEEFKRGKIDLDKFDLIVIDEFHKASGDYPYTKIIKEAKGRTNILGLSASPGDNRTKIEQVERICNIQDWVVAEINTPAKLKDLVIAEPDRVIKTISYRFEALLKKTLKEIDELMPELEIDPEKRYLFGFKETDNWKCNADNLKNENQRKAAHFLIAKYIKLYHCYSVSIKESYATLLGYTEKLRRQDSKSAQSILKERYFRDIISVVKDNFNDHPKTVMLEKVLGKWADLKKNAIVFVNQRDTGEYLKQFLNLYYIRAENIFGGGDKKNLKKQDEALSRIAKRDLDVLISTSVIEEGVSVPEVDMIVHYSRPLTGVGYKQRNGRTARLTKGNIISLVIDHPLDILDHKISQAKAGQGERSLKKHVKKREQVQLTLFSDKEDQ